MYPHLTEILHAQDVEAGGLKIVIALSRLGEATGSPFVLARSRDL